MEKFGAMWRSVGRYGDGGVQSNMGKSGATWRSVRRYGEVQSNVEKFRASVEKGYVFYFDYKLEFCPEATKLLYKTSEIPE